MDIAQLGNGAHEKVQNVNREVQTKENIHNSIKIFTAKRSIDIKHNVDYKSS